ncbi:gluconate:H+ symporter [Sporocytophaga myxococcoides]|uniref:gluconate:H+ symporter n=1 Tax=Sporocytophaga myxococcoides TaxID=153721 RepID=UPI0003F78B4E|nr:gluconate:H+ symporter [Sporocytophaga myxococcoides]
MPVILITCSILLLLVLMLFLKFNAFISLTLVSLFLGISFGMPADNLISSIQKGFGDTLGSLTFIVVFGAMLGKIVGESGAALQISNSLNRLFGPKNVVWAVVLTGFIIGIPLFYTAGFVLLIPLVFTIAAVGNFSPVYIGIPMAAALSVTHGFLPPHPGPVALASIFKADLGLTLIYGSIIAVPAIVLAGPFYGRFVKDIKSSGSPAKSNVQPLELPSFGISLFTALFPVLLISIGACLIPFLTKETIVYKLLSFWGNPFIAMLLAVIVATYNLGISRGQSVKEVMDLYNVAISEVALIILIIGAGGAFKQVLIDSKSAEYLAEIFRGSSLSPLVLAWTMAAIIRLALGSATVAALTSAGIILPLIQSSHVSPELTVLSIGAGSLMFSHVNDAGFWIFKEYFNLSIAQTIRSWSIMETIVSVTGLAGVLLLDLILVS